MNTIKEASQIKDPVDFTQMSHDFFIAMVSKGPVSIQAGGQDQAESNIQMCLERVFVDCFRERTTSQLRSQFTTTNKKLQKRKIKKIKQREQEQEREREAKRLEEQKAKDTSAIKMNN